MREVALSTQRATRSSPARVRTIRWLAVLAAGALAGCFRYEELRHGHYADLDGPSHEVYATARETLARLGLRQSGVKFTPLNRGDRNADLRRGRYRYSLSVEPLEGERSRLFLGSDEHRLAFGVVFHEVLAAQRAAGRAHGEEGFRDLPAWLAPAQAGVRLAAHLAARPA